MDMESKKFSSENNEEQNTSLWFTRENIDLFSIRKVREKKKRLRSVLMMKKILDVFIGDEQSTGGKKCPN